MINFIIYSFKYNILPISISGTSSLFSFIFILLSKTVQLYQILEVSVTST